MKSFKRILCMLCILTTLFSLPALAEKRGNSTGNIVNIGYILSGTSADSYDLTIQFMNYYDGYIYFVNQNDSGRLYRYDSNGGERISTSKDTAYVNVVDDYIFFVDVPAGYRITRTELDGSCRKVLCKIRASRLCAVNGFLYFAGWDSNTKGLWCMDYNGENRYRLYKNDVPLYINVSDDAVYWISNSKKQICRTDLCTEKTVFYSGVKGATCLNYSNNKLYFIWDGDCGYGIYSAKTPSSGTLSPVLEVSLCEKADCLNISGKTAVYRVGGGKTDNKVDGWLESATLN